MRERERREANREIWQKGRKVRDNQTERDKKREKEKKV